LEKALVSVIVPAFDAAASIRQTLNSVLAQTYQEIEVIVVDDGSSDATSAIVEEFVARDPRFHLIRQSNAGVGAARNTAIRKARGKYVAPLDADDYWFPGKLEKQVACMEQSGRETGLVYCWSTVIDDQGGLLSSCSHTVEGRLRRVLILRNVVGNGLHHGSVHPPLKRSGFTSREPNNTGAKIGISIFGLLNNLAFASYPNICSRTGRPAPV
jgi:glycosyltransferase involved in cell wall biosynthesis